MASGNVTPTVERTVCLRDWSPSVLNWAPSSLSSMTKELKLMERNNCNQNLYRHEKKIGSSVNFVSFLISLTTL